jgi:hypothetical protein
LRREMAFSASWGEQGRIGGEKRRTTKSEWRGFEGEGSRHTLVRQKLAHAVPLLLVLQAFLVGENDGSEGGFEVLVEGSSAGRKVRRRQWKSAVAHPRKDPARE